MAAAGPLAALHALLEAGRLVAAIDPVVVVAAPWRRGQRLVHHPDQLVALARTFHVPSEHRPVAASNNLHHNRHLNSKARGDSAPTQGA
eukprot:4752239-Alexandrium_andersonii.AAC.1